MNSRKAKLKPVIPWLTRSILVGVSYTVALIGTGMFLAALGVRFGKVSQGADMLLWLFVGGTVVGLVLGAMATQLAATRTRHLIVWTFVIFFGFVSALMEGSFFEPDRVGGILPALVIQQLILAVLTASVITLLFAEKPSATIVLPPRAWYDWLWRLVVSAASYLVFYLVFGSINYWLVTKRFYDIHTGGIVVPAAEIILVAEISRGIMVLLSVLPFLLTASKPVLEVAVLTGLILFAIGGIVPLLYQIGTLPTALLIASGIEIFFQNFSTGIVAALLLGRTIPLHNRILPGVALD